MIFALVFIFFVYCIIYLVNYFMDIGISTACYFARTVVEDAVSAIAATGCKKTELFLNTASEYTDAFADLLATRAAAGGLQVYSVHPQGSQFESQLFSIYGRQREDSLRTFEQVLRVAKRLGAEVYVFHGPAAMRSIGRTISREWLGSITRDLCAMAKSYGVKLAWENVSWCLFSEPGFAATILDAAKTDDLYFTFDVKQAARSGYDPFMFLETIGTKLADVHLCDYSCENGVVRPQMPCKGCFSFEALGNKLREMNYQGPAFLEVYSDTYQDMKELEASYRALKKAMA